MVAPAVACAVIVVAAAVARATTTAATAVKTNCFLQASSPHAQADNDRSLAAPGVTQVLW